MLDDTSRDVIKASIVYNPFEVENRTDAELIHQPGCALPHYMDGLPEDIEWAVALNEVGIPKEGWALTFPAPGDRLVVMPVPEGGGGGSGDGKATLALVATIALSIAAPFAGTAIANAIGVGAKSFALVESLATAAVSITGGILISAMIPPPENTNDSGDLAYGIDGPKNSSTEGVPYPVLYGEHAFGGNVADLYTENATDENGKAVQYLYMRVIASEGPIDSFGQLYLNNQPIEEFDDVEVDYRLGNEVQTVADWFSETVQLQNQGRELTTSWQTYTTSQEVDKLRLDFVAATGLGATDNKGRKVEVSVELEAEYSRAGKNKWKPFSAEKTWQLRDDPNQTSKAFKVQVGVTDQRFEDRGSTDVDYEVTLRYRIKDSGDAWTALETKTGKTRSNTAATLTWEETGLPDEAYEFDLVTNVDPRTTVTIGDVWVKDLAPLIMADDSSTTIRRTFKTGKLKEDFYDIRYRRVNEETGNDGWQETITLADVGEITTEPTSLPYLAWIGVKIRLTGQINGIPNFTGVGKGRLVPIFDHNGNITDIRYSNNAADVALDMYFNDRYGGAMQEQRIDFASFAEWRDECEARGLTFDGLFYEGSNISDAMKHVFIAGRAQQVNVGAKIGVALDRADNPTFMFDDGNIAKGSFNISYLPFADRINDLEVAFNDKNDKYARRVVRVTNNAALNRGETLKTSTVELKGITDQMRALREGTLRMNMNRLVRRTATWESPIEAVGCSVGDIVIVQHQMPGWGQGGRLLSGTVSQVQLDHEITFEPGESYRLVVHQAKKNIRVNIATTAQTGNLLSLPANKSIDPEDAPDRFISDSLGVDFAVLRVIDATTILLDNAAADHDLTTITDGRIIDTDYLEDVTVTNPAVGSNVTTDTIDLDTDLSTAPNGYPNYIFGKIANTKKPFRIKTLKRSAEGKIQINAIEYVEEVYSDDPEAQAHNYSSLINSAHVTNLRIEENLIERDASYVSRVVLRWEQPDNALYTGAKIYVSINGEPFEEHGETNGTRYSFRADKNDVVIARVVSNSVLESDALSAHAAPTATITISGVDALPDTVTGLTAHPFASGFALTWDRSSDPTLRAYHLLISDTNTPPEPSDDPSEVTVATRLEISDLGEAITRFCWIRQEDVAGNKSPWVGPVSATTLTLDQSSTATDDPLSVALSTSLIADGRAEMTASWAAVTGAAYYELEITRTGGGANIIPVDGTSYSFESAPGVEWSVRLRTRNALNKPSGWTASETLTAASDSTAPPVPGQPTLTPSFQSIWAEWTFAGASDFSHFELCYKATAGTPAFNTTAPVIKTVSQRIEIGGLDTADTRYVFVRAVDSSGNKSDWSVGSSSTTVTVTAAVTSEDLEGLIDQTSFASGLAAVEIVNGVPDDTDPANFPGRMVVDTSDGIGKFYRFIDGTWTSAVDGEDLVLNSVTTGAIRTGAIKTAQLDAGAVTARTLGVGDFTNMILNSQLVNDDGWAFNGNVTVGTDSASDTPGVFVCPVDVTNRYAWTATRIPAEPGDQFFARARARGTGTSEARIVMRFYNKAGGIIEQPSEVMATTSSNQSFTSTQTAPAGTAEMRCDFGRTGGGSGTCYISAPYLMRKNTGEMIVNGVLKANHFVTDEAVITTTAQIKNAIINSAKITDLEASKITVGALNAGITVGATGVTMGTVESRSDDPAIVVNNRSTLIQSGKIQISGSTTIADWRRADDLTTIDGGKIYTGSIKAESLEIGLRGLAVSELNFSTSGDVVSWTAGKIKYIDNNGSEATRNLSSGSFNYSGSNGVVYIYWTRGATSLSPSFDLTLANTGENVVLAAYRGGQDINPNFGRTIIEGDYIATGAISAQKINTASFNASGLAVFGGDLKSSNFNGSIGNSGGERVITSRGSRGFAITKDGHAVFTDIIARDDLVDGAASDGVTGFQSEPGQSASNTEEEVYVLDLGAQSIDKVFTVSFVGETRAADTGGGLGTRMRGWRRLGGSGAWTLVWDNAVFNNSGAYTGYSYTFHESWDSSKVEFRITMLVNGTVTRNNYRNLVIDARDLIK